MSAKTNQKGVSMKSWLFLGVAFLLQSSFAMAEEAPKSGEPPAGRGQGPCAPIVKACREAGFKPGAFKEGKGLWKDCVAKLIGGEKVDGVSASFSAEQLAACKAKQEARMQKRKERKAQSKEGSPAAEGAH
jgi:hypothetical protein